jgi:hypothetical protein
MEYLKIALDIYTNETSIKKQILGRLKNAYKFFLVINLKLNRCKLIQNNYRAIARFIDFNIRLFNIFYSTI